MSIEDYEAQPADMNGAASVYKTAEAELDFDPVFNVFGRKEETIKLEWKDLKYSVGGKGSNSKTILNKISGEAKPGEVMALMGPSGAGKTTLLNILAGRITNGDRQSGKSLSGTITANGVKIKPRSFRRHVAYVTQDDALFPTATVREALLFSAQLRLPSSTSYADKNRIVDDIIQSLGLTKCQNTLIGNELIRGVSGGERKRAAIGTELVSNPTCFFLDEPTSGLDSWSAYVVVRILRAISGTGCTVICSIHQPSSEVFNSFDSLVLLGGQGTILYQGSINDVDGPFAACGLGVPPRTNVADHIMLLAQTLPLDKLPNDNENRRRYGGELPPIFIKNSSDDDVDDETSPKSRHTSISGKISSAALLLGSPDLNGDKPGFFTQTLRLTQREFYALARDKSTLLARFGGTAFLNVLFGLVLLNAGDQSRPKYSVQSHFGSIILLWLAGMFETAQTAVLLFPLERPVFIRERATGTYGTAAYILAKLIVELPVAFATSLLAFLVSYWTIGLSGNFFQLVVSLWFLMLATVSAMYILGAVVASPKAAMELSHVILVPQILFMGIFVRLDQMPDWLSWANYLCSSKYSINLAMLVEFKPENAINDEIRAQFAELLDSNSVHSGDAWWYAVVLVLIFLGFRLIALFLLNEKAKKFSE